MNFDQKSTLIVSILFCLMISLPAVSSLLLQESVSQTILTENRNRAQWPSKTLFLSSVTQYTAQINDYLEDHLPLRQTLLKLFAKIHHKILLKGVSSVSIGQDGWLYLSKGNSLLNAAGIDPMPLTQAEKWIKNALIIKDEVESYGGKFLVVIAPDKAQVYPEFLPKRIVYNRSGRRADTLNALAKTNNLPFLDLLDHLIAQKEKGQQYFKSDTHWNYYGALSAYQRIITELNSMGLNLPIANIEMLRQIEDDSFSGDLARLLNLSDLFNEKRVSLSTYQPPPTKTTEQLLILGDSFYGNTKNYWQYSFAKHDCIHHNWGEINLELIRELQPQIVILMKVERGLSFDLTIDSNKRLQCNLLPISDK